MRKSLLKGFTLAEVLIVLTILGIIATIYMTTLKPADFKAKGMAVAAKKALYDIDTATTEILVNDTSANETAALKSSQCTVANLATLYKKYLAVTRKTGTSAACGGGTKFLTLKSGVCMGISAAATSEIATWFPGETASTNTTSTCAVIYFDVNGEEGPNVVGTDRFVIPVDLNGVKYDTETVSS